MEGLTDEMMNRRIRSGGPDVSEADTDAREREKKARGARRRNFLYPPGESALITPSPHLGRAKMAKIDDKQCGEE